MNRRELASAGEPVRVKASKNAKITPLKGFKDAVMSPATAPRLARGVWPPPTKAPAKAPAKAAAAEATPAADKAPEKPTRAGRYISRLPGRRGR